MQPYLLGVDGGVGSGDEDTRRGDCRPPGPELPPPAYATLGVTISFISFAPVPLLLLLLLFTFTVPFTTSDNLNKKK